nr:MAG TPA: tail protein [Caudoviricetes sp.]
MTYVSPDGASFALTGGQIEVAEGGVDKLTGSVKERAYVAVGMPGQLLESHVIEPIRGALTLVIDSTPTKPAEVLAFELRRAFSHYRLGQLAVATPRGVARLRCRLDGTITDPAEVYSRSSGLELRIPLVADEGVWKVGPYTGTGTGKINVSNFGDTTTYLEITWQGNGGSITLPSGATLTLPTTSDRRHLLLNPTDSCAIIDDASGVDHALWQQIPYLPEGVPAGGQRTYQLPAGATATWYVSALDPWR